MLDKADTIRTFIAIELSAPVQKQIARIQDQLRREPAARIVRWVQTQNVHLTLQFLGDTPVGQLHEIEQSLHEVCAANAPFVLTFGQLGCFPNVHNPRVLWIGVEEPTGRLMHLQREITAATSGLGFKAERRRYSPHLTLGRVKRHVSRKERQRLGDLIGPTDIPALPSMTVDAVFLIRSQLHPSGSIYTTLTTAALATERRQTA